MFVPFVMEDDTHVDLDNLGNAGAGGGDDGLDVVAAGLGQDSDVALNQLASGVGGDLARDEDLAIGADGLGLWGVNWCFLLCLDVGAYGAWVESWWGMGSREGCRGLDRTCRGRVWR